MNPSPPPAAAGSEDEAFSALLAACDEALAGSGPPLGDPPAGGLGDRLARCVACLRQIREALGPPPAVADPRGRRLGDFEAAREIGRGGMGVVYEARQRSLNRPVALKVLGPGLGLSPTAVERFRREAEAAARLHHANIVPIYATGEDDGTHYYAMELVAGPSLDRVLRDIRRGAGPGPLRPQRPSPPSGDPASTVRLEADATDPELRASAGSLLGTERHYFDTVARLVAEVADALQYAHREGVIHRDVKPANLLLAPDGRLRVNDFGLARLLEAPAMTATGDFLGTPAYMSPEQIGAGPAVDCRTDVYSLGATLYELLTLRPPFAGESRAAVIAQVLQTDPVAPRRVNPGVPRDLDTICLKAMEKNPARRYQSAAELAADLRRFLAGEPVAARRVGVLGRVWKATRRRPVVAGLLAAVVALVLGGAAAVTVLWRQAEGALAGERAARRETEAELAAKLVLLARIEWEAGNTARAAEYLRECPDRHRTRDWQYLDRACRAQIAFFSHPTETVACVAFSPDGRFVATVSMTGVLKAWDLATGADVFTAHVSPVSRILELDFTPDGRRLAFAGPLPLTRQPKPADPAPEVWQFRMWDVGTWQLARQGRFENSPPAARSAAGAVRAVADGARMRIENLVTGEVADFPHGHDTIKCLTFNDDGRLLLSGGPNEPFKVWDVGTGRLVSATAARPKTRRHPVLREQLSADGRRAAWYELPAAGDTSVVIVVWDIERDKEVASFRVSPRTVGPMRLSPDGRSLAVADGKAVRVWDLDTREEVVVLRGHAGTICDIAFGAGGRQLASVGRDDTVRVWDVRPFED